MKCKRQVHVKYSGSVTNKQGKLVTHLGTMALANKKLSKM